MLRMLIGWMLALLAGLAAAHPSPSSELALDVGAHSVRARLTLPLDELQLAFPQPLLDGSGHWQSATDAAVGAYLAAHVRPVAPDGRAWLVRVDDVRWALDRRPADVVATVMLVPPPGSPVGDFDLGCDVIAHQVPSHVTVVALQGTDGRPRVLGTLHYGRRSIAVRHADPRWWAGFGDLLKLGMTHIAQGPDHLLFLLTLLLPAALRAEDGKWTAFVGPRKLALNLFGVVTAFTLGHSLTLVLGATGLVTLPSRPVEIAIALSILVSALHAWRPIFPRRESWIAAGFGLVHGLAFADALRELQLSGPRLAGGILAFNLGIEAVQALLVLLAAPLLLLLARTAWLQRARMAVALLAGVLALVWMAARTMGVAIFGMA